MDDPLLFGDYTHVGVYLKSAHTNPFHCFHNLKINYFTNCGDKLFFFESRRKFSTFWKIKINCRLTLLFL